MAEAERNNEETIGETAVVEACEDGGEVVDGEEVEVEVEGLETKRYSMLAPHIGPLFKAIKSDLVHQDSTSFPMAGKYSRVPYEMLTFSREFSDHNPKHYLCSRSTSLVNIGRRSKK